MKKWIVILMVLAFSGISYAQSNTLYTYTLTISQAQNAKESAPTACTVKKNEGSTRNFADPDCVIDTKGADRVWVGYNTLNASVTNSSTDWSINVRGVNADGDTINAVGTDPADTSYYEHDSLGDNAYGGFGLTPPSSYGFKIRADEENVGALGATLIINVIYKKD